ncbi:hypothetical protein [Virgibacillus pantothenticus]|uniref:hypothetical protein n=1 Tax=Virgibacillus pantothenticus TaxID=1473 RepID=UPI000985AD79|nr:hypothetical protein [Virgibacillus pantothenticus]
MLTLYKKHLLPTRPFEVMTITETGEKIKTHAGISVEPDYSIYKHPNLNILIIFKSSRSCSEKCSITTMDIHA